MACLRPRPAVAAECSSVRIQRQTASRLIPGGSQRRRTARRRAGVPRILSPRITLGPVRREDTPRAAPRTPAARARRSIAGMLIAARVAHQATVPYQNERWAALGPQSSQPARWRMLPPLLRACRPCSGTPPTAAGTTTPPASAPGQCRPARSSVRPSSHAATALTGCAPPRQPAPRAATPADAVARESAGTAAAYISSARICGDASLPSAPGRGMRAGRDRAPTAGRCRAGPSPGPWRRTRADPVPSVALPRAGDQRGPWNRARARCGDRRGPARGQERGLCRSSHTHWPIGPWTRVRQGRSGRTRTSPTRSRTTATP